MPTRDRPDAPLGVNLVHYDTGSGCSSLELDPFHIIHELGPALPPRSISTFTEVGA